jgi:hypothetical protein
MNAILPARKFVLTQKDVRSEKGRSWIAPKLDLKAKVVCAPCNSGWMSDIDDDEAKPILRHLIVDSSPRKIHFSELVSIASFTFKSAVVADHMGPGGDPFFTRLERGAFRERLLLPVGLTMWIGALDSTHHGVFRSRHLKPNRTGENDAGVYAFTNVVGHFVVQLAVARWAVKSPARKFQPIIEQSEEWSQRMIPFYPPTKAVTWPPPTFVSKSIADELSDRWSQFHLVQPRGR